MADFSSNLGFDASSAIRSLQSLAVQLEANTRALQNFQRAATGQQLRQTEQQLRDLFRGTQQAKQGAQQLELGWRSVIRVFGIQFAARAVASIVGAFTDGIQAAREFEIRLAEIQTISREFAAGSINDVAEVVTRLSAEFGRPVNDVAAALYQALSNQIGNAAETTRFLTDALEFSVASVTSAKEAVDLLSGVLKAYNLTAASTTDVSNTLFETIRLGRVTGEELNGTFGRVATLGAQAGISFAELASAFATLTIQGVKASDAATQLTGVLISLIKPTKAMQAEFARLGVSSLEAGVLMFGLQGFLEKLTEAGGTATSEIAKLDRNIRGIRGTLGLVGNQVEKANQNLVDITKQAGQTREAFDLINKTNAQQLTRELEAARAFLVNDFGRSVIATFNSLVQAVGGGVNALKLFGGIIGTTVIVALGVFTANILLAAKALTVQLAVAIARGVVLLNSYTFAIAASTAATVAFSVAILAIPVAATAGLILAFSGVSKAIDKATADTKKLRAENEKAAKEEVAATRASRDSRIKANIENAQAVGTALQSRIAALQQEQLANFQTQSKITGDLGKNIVERSSKIDKFFKELQTQVDNGKKFLGGLANGFKDLFEKTAENTFERSLKGLTEAGEARERLARADELIAKAGVEARKGTEEGGKQALKLTEEAISQAERVADLDTQRRRGQEKVNDLLNEAARIEATANNTNVARLKAEQKSIDNNARINKEIEATGTAFTDVAKKVTEVNTAITNEANLPLLSADTRTAIQAVNNDLDALITNLTEGANSAAQFVLTTSDLSDIENSAAGAIDRINALREKAIQAIKTGDTATLAQVQTQIKSDLAVVNSAESKAIGLGNFNDEVARSLTQLGLDIAKAAEAQATLNVALAQVPQTAAASDALARLGDAARNNQDILPLLGDSLLRIGKGATTTGTGLSAIGAAAPAAVGGIQAVQGVVDSFNTGNIIAQVQAAIEALQQLAAAQAASGGGGGGGFARGGLVGGGSVDYFAQGGKARGTDTIPAMLSKGEFVVNAASTRRFFSQLVAINSGRQPVFRQEGGAVNQTFGDININVPEGRAPVDGRELARELRRQLRRNTVRTL